MLTSQVSVYLGSDGFVSKTPFMKRQTKGWLPNVLVGNKGATADSALLAEFKALYPHSAAYNSAKKFMPSSTLAEM